MKYKSLSKIKDKIEAEVLLMLAAHRDCLWNRFSFDPKRPNPNKIMIDAGEGFYGEAFGILRALEVLGYGYFGPSNLNAVEDGKSGEPEHNLKWWIYTLEKRIIAETGYPHSTKESTNEILNKYRKLCSDLKKS